MKISILGAIGSVGAPVAFNIAVSGLADELLMIDVKSQNLLEHHALDIQTAASLNNVTVMSGNYEDLPGSDVVINVAGAHLSLNLDRRKRLGKQTRFVRDIVLKINTYCPDAIIVTAVNPVDALNYATYLSGDFDRRKLIGYSINDSIRFRETLAKELKEKVNNVDGIVIGEHGSTQVPLFSSVKVGDDSVSMTDHAKQRIRSGMFDMIRKFESLKAGRTAGWTCAVGFTAIVKAIAEEQKTVLPCSIVLNGEYGQDNISMSVPVTLGRDGVKEILEYKLTPDEQEGLRGTVETLHSDAAVVRDTLASS
ncbi:MAG: malate dehydrogenase [Desulfocapsaceae bacterium]